MLLLSQMFENPKQKTFLKYAWFVFGFNVLVILWGVFLRASHSGDGCGEHWLTCHGEIIPSAPELKTVIEFLHRLMSGLDFFITLAMAILAWRWFEKGNNIRKFAFASFGLIIVEALIGAGLVLTGNTAGADTPTRPFWTMGHLIATFILLAVLSLTIYYAKGGKSFSLKTTRQNQLLLGLGLVSILFVGLSGSLAALSNMLFPSESLAEGIAKDFSSASHILLRLRISHPLLSILTTVYLFFLATWISKNSNEATKTWAGRLTLLLFVQLVFGGLTLVMLAPILMQIGHLLLADLVWICFVMMSVNYLSEKSQ
jgi:heme A synthase